jgi:hypothetical protein
VILTIRLNNGDKVAKQLILSTQEPPNIYTIVIFFWIFRYNCKNISTEYNVLDFFKHLPGFVATVKKSSLKSHILIDITGKYLNTVFGQFAKHTKPI